MSYFLSVIFSFLSKDRMLSANYAISNLDLLFGDSNSGMSPIKVANVKEEEKENVPSK